MVGSRSVRALLLAAALAVGCTPQMGDCDQAAAIRVAYDQATGLPAYEGQALMIASCGHGAFCHAGDDVPRENRLGVPEGLSFDVQLAAPDGTVDEAAIVRQRRARFRTVQEAHLVLHTVDLGTMPPPSEVGREVLAGAPVYVRASAGGFEALPAVGSEEGREILRNWLACAAPVIERPVPREDGVNAVVVPPLPLEPLEPTWASLFEDLLRGRGCATALCHGGSDAGFRVTDSASTHAALTTGAASGEECAGQGALIVAGDPDASLFVDKLGAEPRCGDPMPLGGIPLRDEDLEAVRAWIAAGALIE